MTSSMRDRYQSFDGLDCDTNATQVLDTVRRHMAAPDGGGRWGDYFRAKFTEQQRLGVDDLFFVGSQMNNLFAFLDEVGDEAGHALLYQVEQECC